MMDDVALLESLRATPDLLAAVAACSPAERASQKSLRGQFPDELVRAAVGLQEARGRAAGRLPHAERLWLTRTGLEQASAWDVAIHKAKRLAGCGYVVDLCCGIGSDAAALSHHGQVTAVDRSPAMVLRATWNAEVLGRPERFFARCGDVTAEDWTGRFVHADPDRRDGRDRPARWLEHYQPGLDWMRRLIATARGGAIKVGPASDFPGKFPGCEIELVSLGDECREATIWFGELAGAEPARATNLTTGESLAGDPALSARRIADTLGGFLVDPDPAVVRAGLLDVLAERHGMLRLDADEEYLTTDQLPATSLATAFKVEAVLPASVKELRRHLRQRPAHHYEIKCRRLKIDVEDVRRQLPTGDAPPCVVIFCRIGGRARAVIGRRSARDTGFAS
jgi:SAM-dependent methyltransferase